MGLHPSHSIISVTFIMSSTPVNTFNKSKEDFIWFVKKAVQDKKSYSHSEMYHSLLKLFVDADTNKDGLVSKASFSKLIDAAATMPRAYGYAPADADLYKTEAEKDAARCLSLTKAVLKSTRSSSRLPSRTLTVPSPWNFTGTCWRSSPSMIVTRMELSNWLSFLP